MSYEQFIKTQSYTRKSSNLAKLGFNFENPKQELEYLKIQELLSNEYLILGESMLTLQEKYKIPSSKTLYDLFKILGIKSRSFSDANRMAFEKNRSSVPCTKQCYKCGWHTTWDNKQVYLRSSYEFDYAYKLDEQKILYEVEFMRIKYYCSQDKIFKIAIPDFILPETKKIVEIKSKYFYDPIQMKDRFIAYKKLCYMPILILEGNETEV